MGDELRMSKMVKDTDLTHAVSNIFSEFGKTFNVSLPCQVVGVDGSKVSVKPLVSMVSDDDKVVNRAVVHNIPILQMGTSAFSLKFKIQAGDKGWIIAQDRDIDSFSGSMCVPTTERTHNFNDSLFMPDCMSGKIVTFDFQSKVTILVLSLDNME